MLFPFIFLSLLTVIYCDFHLPDINDDDIPSVIVDPIRPVSLPRGPFGESVQISLSAHVLYLAVDTAKQEFEVIMYFRQEWKDNRLAFESPDPWRFQVISDPTSLWTPDLFFVNEIVKYERTLNKRNSFIRLYPDGTIIMSERLTVRASCPMYLRIYPFDTQTCELQIESYGYSTDDLTLNWNRSSDNPITGEPTTLDFNVNLDWQSSFVQLRGEEYGRCLMEFNLKRNPMMIILRLILPITATVISSWASFFFDNEKDFGIRFGLCLSPIFAYLLELNFASPFFLQIGYLTGLDIWVSFCFVIMVAAFFESIYVMYKSNKNNDETEVEADAGKKDKSGRIDFKAKIIFSCSFLLFNAFCAVYVCLAQDF